MELLDTITVQQPNKTAEIQLFMGDLSAIPGDNEVDLLIVSAFPDDYTPNPGSVIGSLYQRGLSVAELAANKLIDLRGQLNCWLSQPLSETEQELMHFRQLICFEPHRNVTDAVEAVSNIFRCLNYFALDDSFNVIAMPVVASGNQKIPFRKMMPALVKAAIFWLDQGLPIDCIKIAIIKEEDIAEAREVFAREKQAYEAISKPGAGAGDMAEKMLEGATTAFTAPQAANEVSDDAAEEAMIIPLPTAAPAAKAPGLDMFISYAHVQTQQVQHFVDCLKQRNPVMNVFYDRTSIPSGGLWLKQISDAIGKADRILIFLSPDYSRSPVCWDEFQCAKIREYNSGKSLIQTIYLMTDNDLPPMMTLNSWIDCREGDLEKLASACDQLLAHIAAP
jgi:hypothetical protein